MPSSADLGLDRPYHEQYLIWVWQMVSLDPGHSIFTNEPIPVALRKAIPVTLELATLAMILGLAIAIPIGVLSATRQDTASDYAGRLIAVFDVSSLPPLAQERSAVITSRALATPARDGAAGLPGSRLRSSSAPASILRALGGRHADRRFSDPPLAERQDERAASPDPDLFGR